MLGILFARFFPMVEKKTLSLFAVLVGVSRGSSDFVSLIALFLDNFLVPRISDRVFQVFFISPLMLCVCVICKCN